MPVNVSLQADKHLHAVNATESFLRRDVVISFPSNCDLNLTNQ